jgi:hypothetical protein
MGQELFNPPNVAGWKSNDYWISTSSVSARAHFVDDVANYMRNKNLLVDTVPKPPDQAVKAVLDQMQVLLPAVRTTEVLTGFVNAQRAAKSANAEPGNLTRLAMLAPDLQMA